MPNLNLKLVQEWDQEEVEQFCKDVLTVAAEGGINYWATFNTERDEDLYVLAIHNVCDAEDEALLAESLRWDAVWGILQRIAVGDIQVAHSAVLRYITDDLLDKECCNIDADCADVIVQLALFGEVVYG